MSPSPIDLTINGSIPLRAASTDQTLNTQQMSLPPLCPLSHHRVSKAIVSRESGGVTPLPPAGQPRVSGESGIAEGGGKRGLEVSASLTSMLPRENIWNLRHLCIVNRMDVPALAPAWPPPTTGYFLHVTALTAQKPCVQK